MSLFAAGTATPTGVAEAAARALAPAAPSRCAWLLPCCALALLASGCATHGPQPRYSKAPPPSYRGHNGSDPTLLTSLHEFYERWDGTPYRYGGRSKSGVDCSSFVRQAVDATESYPLPRTTTAQARRGTWIPRPDLEVGDLVFFRTGRRAHHVGIYLGDGRFMHVSSRKGVTISQLDNRYWRNHYWQARHLPEVAVTHISL